MTPAREKREKGGTSDLTVLENAVGKRGPGFLLPPAQKDPTPKKLRAAQKMIWAKSNIRDPRSCDGKV